MNPETFLADCASLIDKAAASGPIAGLAFVVVTGNKGAAIVEANPAINTESTVRIRAASALAEKGK